MSYLIPYDIKTLAKLIINKTPVLIRMEDYGMLSSGFKIQKRMLSTNYEIIYIGRKEPNQTVCSFGTKSTNISIKNPDSSHYELRYPSTRVIMFNDEGTQMNIKLSSFTEDDLFHYDLQYKSFSDNIEVLNYLHNIGFTGFINTINFKW